MGEVKEEAPKLCAGANCRYREDWEGWLPAATDTAPGVADEPLRGVRLNYATFKRVAMREETGNFWRDASIRYSREFEDGISSRMRWEDDGGPCF